MQKIIRKFREESGEASVDMHKVAAYAEAMGWPMPKPRTALERLAEQFSSAAREEVRRDNVTGRPYRVNLAVTTWQGQQQLTLWTDIDEAPRPIAHKSFQQRREQMVGSAVQLTDDVAHWNRVNPEQTGIQMEMDLRDDVLWRQNAPDEDQEEAA